MVFKIVSLNTTEAQSPLGFLDLSNIPKVRQHPPSSLSMDSLLAKYDKGDSEFFIFGTQEFLNAMLKVGHVQRVGFTLPQTE